MSPYSCSTVHGPHQQIWAEEQLPEAQLNNMSLEDRVAHLIGPAPILLQYGPFPHKAPEVSLG